MDSMMSILDFSFWILDCSGLSGGSDAGAVTLQGLKFKIRNPKSKTDLLHFPRPLRQPLPQDLPGGLALGGVAAVGRAAFAERLPLPDHETRHVRVAVPSAEEALVETPLHVQIQRLLDLGVVPRLVGGVA